MKLKTIHEAKSASFGPNTVIPIKLEYTIGRIADIAEQLEGGNPDAETFLKMFNDHPVTLEIMVRLVTAYHEYENIGDARDQGGVGIGDMVAREEDWKTLAPILQKYGGY